MIVEQFIQWVTTAAPEKRAKATKALARAYLNNEFDEDDHDAAEAAMTFLLDDPDICVREALMETLVGSNDAPRHIILGLLDDAPQIGAIVAARSPMLFDTELVDLIAGREDSFQFAVAGRMPLSSSVCAAIAEVTRCDVCLRLLKNPGAHLLPRTLLRLAERFGNVAEMQHVLLQREDLPIAARQLLVVNLSDALCASAARDSKMDHERAEDISRDARDRATLTLIRNIEDYELPELIEHLRDTEQLTTVLMLRVICAGQIMFFAESLALLSNVPSYRVMALLNDRSSKTLRSIYLKSGLPEQAYPAFSIAFDTYIEQGAVVDQRDQYRFTRVMIERILERYSQVHVDGVDELLTMLCRFASETARDAARSFVNYQIEAA